MNASDFAPLLVLVGPTGAGKTAVALEVCERLGGEIVSADAMQIYRGCDIATAKPSREEQQRAPHHLIDICDPRQSFSAAQWAGAARATIAAIRARGGVPVVAGGTGFYLNALLRPGLAAPAPPNAALRAELARELAASGPLALHERLRAADPDAAARLHLNDTFRVTRALEVARWRREHNPTLDEPEPAALPFRAFRLDVLREQLYARLDARVDAMLEAGAVEELRGLLASGVPRDAPALRGVGYKELLPAIADAARLSGRVEDWKRATRHYAKRQGTWFRHQLAATPLDMDALSPAQAAALISAA